MRPSVRNNRALNRFEIEFDGLISALEYSDQNGVLTLEHTFVPPVLRGRGIAAILTKFAIQTALQEKMKIDPQCSYAAVFLKRHPEYAKVRMGDATDTP